MQTFAPEGRDIRRGFQVLDRQRLGKQRVETYQILRTLLGLSDGWASHPATLMWSNHIPALAYYGYVNCQVWKERGYNDNLQHHFANVVRAARTRRMQRWCSLTTAPPMFLDEIMESHRSALIRKAPEHYSHIWPDTPRDLEYVWVLDYD